MPYGRIGTGGNKTIEGFSESGDAVAGRVFQAAGRWGRGPARASRVRRSEAGTQSSAQEQSRARHEQKKARATAVPAVTRSDSGLTACTTLRSARLGRLVARGCGSAAALGVVSTTLAAAGLAAVQRAESPAYSCTMTKQGRRDMYPRGAVGMHVSISEQ
eukprot:365381-Chlamydomonas_euryale.AAC.27